MPLVYEELRQLARRYLACERADHTLQATALVHEVYLRLADQTRLTWKDRAHFYGIAARMMRQILVDHARVHNAADSNRSSLWRTRASCPPKASAILSSSTGRCTPSRQITPATSR